MCRFLKGGKGPGARPRFVLPVPDFVEANRERVNKLIQL
jgi:hypothetical protein